MNMRKSLTRSAACVAQVILAVIFPTLCLSADNEIVSVESRLSDILGYYFKGEGMWRQDNADFVTGSGSPVAYIKQYSWGPGKAMVFDDTYVLMEDGSCRPWAHLVFNWDFKEQRVQGNIFHAEGLWFTGVISKSGELSTSAVFSATMPDGSEFRMRDSTDLSNPKVATISAEIWDGQTFVPADESGWTLVEDGAHSCELQ